jgi:hypothetical protein
MCQAEQQTCLIHAAQVTQQRRNARHESFVDFFIGNAGTCTLRTGRNALRNTVENVGQCEQVDIRLQRRPRQHVQARSTIQHSEIRPRYRVDSSCRRKNDSNREQAGKQLHGPNDTHHFWGNWGGWARIAPQLSVGKICACHCPGSISSQQRKEWSCSATCVQYHSVWSSQTSRIPDAKDRFDCLAVRTSSASFVWTALLALPPHAAPLELVNIPLTKRIQRNR